jgi:hypothetical protein
MNFGTREKKLLKPDDGNSGNRRRKSCTNRYRDEDSVSGEKSARRSGSPAADFFRAIEASSLENR